MKTYSFEDGKYQYDVDEYGCVHAARRHGEPWPAGLEAVRYSKSFMAVLHEIDRLNAVIDQHVITITKLTARKKS